MESYNDMSDARTVAMSRLCECETLKIAMFQTQLQGLSNAVNMFIMGNHGGLEDALEKLEKSKLALADAPQTVTVGSGGGGGGAAAAAPSRDAAPY